MLAVARDIGGSCFIASATTAAGFGSFATSGALSFLHFGVIAAFGVMAALVLCFTLLPVWLVRLPFDSVTIDNYCGKTDCRHVAVTLGENVRSPSDCRSSHAA